jgi:hypothetical protein
MKYNTKRRKENKSYILNGLLQRTQYPKKYKLLAFLSFYFSPTNHLKKKNPLQLPPSSACSTSDPIIA